MTMITPQDITQATEKMNQAWKLVKSLEDLASSIHGQLSYQLDFIENTEEVAEENQTLRNQLATVESQKAKLLAEIETLTAKISALQKDLDSRPPKVEDPPTTPPVDPETDKIIATIPFTIKDTTGQGRLAGEYAFTGIPLAQKLGVKDVNQLRVGDSVSLLWSVADIRPTSYWLDGSIQWVQVVFPVVGFSDSIQYELLVYEKPQKLVASQIAALGDTNIGDVEVRTGDRKWQVDIAGVHQEGLEGKGLNTTFDGKSSSNDYLRNLYVEYLGPLVCYVVVEGSTSLNFSTYTDKHGNLRPARISFRRRYQFLANSPLVTVQETIRWEGSFNGTSHEKNQPEKPYGQRDPNAVLGQLWRERFTLTSSVQDVMVLDATIEEPQLFHDNPQEVALTQSLRKQRLKDDKKSAYSPRYEITTNNTIFYGGEKADGGLISIRTTDQYVTVALKDMHLHEPQAIRLVGNKIQLDLASDKFWLPHHSGVEVTYAIHVDSKQPDLNHIWRQVNKPLRGLCQPEQYNESGGFDCLGGILIPKENTREMNMQEVDFYDINLDYTVNNTTTKMQSEGFQGLMTWGSVPRYWEEWGFNTGEMGSGVDGWDGLMRNWSATDYWCTFKLALEWAIRSGDPQWIETLTIPAASRMLHTQIMQAAPDDSWFYAGQAPAGYAMYRSDFNSSHQYWENLYLYYLVTGDRTVIDIIERGALNQINYMNDKKGVVGRQPMQWLQAYLFLSHCHYAEGSRLTFSRAFDMFMKQAITNHYLEGKYQGEMESIWTQQPVRTTGADLLTMGTLGSGAYESHQLFSLCFYDMEMLYHYGLRTNNAKIESLGVRPFDIMTRIAKTIIRRGIGSTTKNVETSAWLRIFSTDYDGKGNFTRFEGGVVDPEIVNGQIVGGQRILFPDDKGTMCLFFSRCAWMSNDPKIKKVSRELVQLMFNQVAGRGLPFGKLIGMLMGRLSGAVAIEQMIEERGLKGETK